MNLYEPLVFSVTETIADVFHRVSTLQQWDHHHCSLAMKSCSRSRDVLADCLRWGLRNGLKWLDHQRMYGQKVERETMDILHI